MDSDDAIIAVNDATAQVAPGIRRRRLANDGRRVRSPSSAGNSASRHAGILTRMVTAGYSETYGAAKQACDPAPLGDATPASD